MEDDNEEMPLKQRKAMDGSGKKKDPVDYEAMDRQAAELVAAAAKPGGLPAALEALLNLEKAQRLAADVPGTKKFAVAVVKACRAANAWKELNENVVLLSKRRAQLKQAVVAAVQEAMGYISQTPSVEARVELISTLQTVAAGKIYLELERARLVRQLAAIKESQGKLDEAAEVIQEVAVETFGAMSKQEKIGFILEQVRLCLDKGDYVRAQILAKKVSPRSFTAAEEAEAKKRKEADKKDKASAEASAAGGEAGPAGGKAKDSKDDKAAAKEAGPSGGPAPMEEEPPALAAGAPPEGWAPPMPLLKLKYYELMIRFYQNTDEYLEMTRCLQAIYEEPSIASDPAKWNPILRQIAWCVVLAPHGPEQSSMLHAAAADKRLGDLPASKELLRQFVTQELISWKAMLAAYEPDLAAEAVLFGGPKGAPRREHLRKRVVEHNLLVLAKYYSRLSLQRLAQLLDLPADEAEKHLCEVVVSKTVSAKIDRPAGMVVFGGRQDADDLLNAWSGGLDKLLVLVERSCHMIHKDAMMHKVSLGS